MIDASMKLDPVILFINFFLNNNTNYFYRLKIDLMIEKRI